ncbi:MAG: sulfate ABC transporter permease subunit [Anaerolineales bacterium]|nr:sulfate ABC transporter permease subunit [Anaerolineales bacterium]
MNENPLPRIAAPSLKSIVLFSQRLIGNKAKWVQRSLIFVVVVYVGLLILAPLAALTVSAFEKGAGAIFSSLKHSNVLISFWNTLWISLVVVLIHTLFGTIVAWVFVRHRFPGRSIINGLIEMPFVISPVVTGYMLLLIFGRSGILSNFVEATGIRVAFAFPGMVMATLFVTLPFMIRELIPVLENFDASQEKAAATLGANSWQIFWRVTLPALRWGLIYGITLTFARALGEFGAVLVIGGAAQGKMMTTTLFIYHALEERQYIAAYSAALLLGVFSLALVSGSNWVRNKVQR